MSEQIQNSIAENAANLQRELGHGGWDYPSPTTEDAAGINEELRSRYLETEDHRDRVRLETRAAIDVSNTLRESISAEISPENHQRGVDIDLIKEHADRTGNGVATAAVEYFNKAKSLGEASNTALILRKAALYNAKDNYSANQGLIHEAALKEDSARTVGK